MKKNFSNKITSLLTSAALIMLSSSCNAVSQASSTDYTRIIEIKGDFSGLITHNAIEITYTQDNKPSRAVISGPQEIVEEMTYIINNKGSLDFRLPLKTKNIRKNITIKLNGHALLNYTASSAGVIKVTTPVTISEPLNFNLSSSGEVIMLKQVGNKFSSIKISGASMGEVRFKEAVVCNAMHIALASTAGCKAPSIETETLNYAGSSTGNLETLNLKADNVRIAIASGAEANIKQLTVNSLKVAASSGGEMSSEKLIGGNIQLDASSGGTITLQGTANQAGMSASSGGEININKLVIKKITSCKSSSGGNISFSN